jgi:hypothetical protein
VSTVVTVSSGVEVAEGMVSVGEGVRVGVSVAVALGEGVAVASSGVTLGATVMVEVA